MPSFPFGALPGSSPAGQLVVLAALALLALGVARALRGGGRAARKGADTAAPGPAAEDPARGFLVGFSALLLVASLVAFFAAAFASLPVLVLPACLVGGLGSFLPALASRPSARANGVGVGTPP